MHALEWRGAKERKWLLFALFNYYALCALSSTGWRCLLMFLISSDMSGPNSSGAGRAFLHCDGRLSVQNASQREEDASLFSASDCSKYCPQKVYSSWWPLLSEAESLAEALANIFLSLLSCPVLPLKLLTSLASSTTTRCSFLHPAIHCRPSPGSQLSSADTEHACANVPNVPILDMPGARCPGMRAYDIWCAQVLESAWSILGDCSAPYCVSLFLFHCFCVSVSLCALCLVPLCLCASCLSPCRGCWRCWRRSSRDLCLFVF